MKKTAIIVIDTKKLPKLAVDQRRRITLAHIDHGHDTMAVREWGPRGLVGDSVLVSRILLYRAYTLSANQRPVWIRTLLRFLVLLPEFIGTVVSISN